MLVKYHNFIIFTFGIMETSTSISCCEIVRLPFKVMNVSIRPIMSQGSPSRLSISIHVVDIIVVVGYIESLNWSFFFSFLKILIHCN